eukprot:GFKZ01011248.1.p1 GENE.GFKZ01011248.1~~GFKZ01011248.1.p1  ORF type:complete len:404 (+),score=49.49 GFKZ01011248.1:41-1252(+)
MAPPILPPSSIPLVDLQAEYDRHGPAILTAITQVAQSANFILGPEVTQLEQKLAAYVQGQHTPFVHCVGVSDGTIALQLCLQALNIGAGDEVVTVPFTWISTAEVIALVGAEPVFVDVERDSYLIDATKLEKAVNQRTKAVIVVSLFGMMPDMAGIKRVLDACEEKYGTQIALIEDGAQSFGARRGGSLSCGAPECLFSTTSFFPTKPLACYGDGGAVFTRDEEMARVIRALRVHGKVAGEHTMVGVNGRLDTIQAAVLLVKLTHFEDMLKARRKAVKVYEKLLDGERRVVLPKYTRILKAHGDSQSAWGVYTVRVQRRDEVVARLKEAGVGCAIYYKHCCHLQPVFKGVKSEEGSLSVAEELSRDVLSLPIHPYLTEEAQIIIVEGLRAALSSLGVEEPPSY